MYRFLLQPKWIAFHLLCIVGIVAMLSAASWQWTRYNERNDFVDLVGERQEAEPQDLATMLDTESPAEIEFYRVTGTGSYVADEQLTEINRTQGGANGVNVLTPFQIDGGPLIIVNRGFVANGIEVPPPPTGQLVVGGTARTTEVRRTGELTDNNSGQTDEVRRVDLPLISEQLGVELAPIYIEMIATQPASPQPPDPVPPPDLSGGPPHLSYTVQWCIFSACVVVGWVFAVRRSARKRARDASRASAAADGSTVSEDEPRAVPSA